MIRFLWHRLGRQAAHAAVGGRRQGSRLNMKLGFALFKDGRVSFWTKLFALGLGGLVTALLIALEISPEMLLAAVMPALGLALDFVTDGMEAVILPFLLGALLLPFVAPRALVDQLMLEREGTPALSPPAL